LLEPERIRTNDYATNFVEWHGWRKLNHSLGRKRGRDTRQKGNTSRKKANIAGGVREMKDKQTAKRL